MDINIKEGTWLAEMDAHGPTGYSVLIVAMNEALIYTTFWKVVDRQMAEDTLRAESHTHTEVFDLLDSGTWVITAVPQEAP